MSYGLLCGRVGDHNVDPYAAHITSITGREITAEKLGLIQVEAAAVDTDKPAVKPAVEAMATPPGVPTVAAEAAAAPEPIALQPPAVHDADAAAAGAVASPAAPAAAPTEAHFRTPMVDMSG